MKLVLPIYWVQVFVRNKDKNWLCGLNQLFSMHYQVRNKLKQHYHKLVADQIGSMSIDGPYTVEYTLYYKNVKSDPGNIIAGIEKVMLDGLQEAGAIVEDNPNYHLGTSWVVAGKDRLNPRCEITIKPYKEPHE